AELAQRFGADALADLRSRRARVDDAVAVRHGGGERVEAAPHRFVERQRLLLEAIVPARAGAGPGQPRVGRTVEEEGEVRLEPGTSRRVERANWGEVEPAGVALICQGGVGGAR